MIEEAEAIQDEFDDTYGALEKYKPKKNKKTVNMLNQEKNF